MKLIAPLMLVLLLIGQTREDPKMKETFFKAIADVRKKQSKRLFKQYVIARKSKATSNFVTKFRGKQSSLQVQAVKRHLHRQRLAASTFYGVHPDKVARTAKAASQRSHRVL